MEFAENLALDHKYDKELGHRLKAEPSRQGYHYTNAKKLNVLAEEEEPTVEELKSRKKKGEEEEEVSSVYEGQQWSLGK